MSRRYRNPDYSRDSYVGRMFYDEIFALAYCDEIVFFGICRHREKGYYYVYEIECDFKEDEEHRCFKPLRDICRQNWLAKLQDETLICQEEHQQKVDTNGYADIVGMKVQIKYSMKDKMYYFPIRITERSHIYNEVLRRTGMNPDTGTFVAKLIYSDNPRNETKYDMYFKVSKTWFRINKFEYRSVISERTA